MKRGIGYRILMGFLWLIVYVWFACWIKEFVNPSPTDWFSAPFHMTLLFGGFAAYFIPAFWDELL